MKHNRFRGTEKGRRGFSLAEVVVGLTIVAMVSAAALSVIMSSVQMEAKYLNETTALCACESVVACVRFSEDEEKLKAALEELTEKPEDGDAEEERVTPTNEDGYTVLTFKQNTVKVTVKYAENAFVNGVTDTFEITAKTMSGETIQQVKYEKN